MEKVAFCKYVLFVIAKSNFYDLIVQLTAAKAPSRKHGDIHVDRYAAEK